MKIIDSIFKQKKYNTTAIVEIILNLFGIKYTKDKIYDLLENHIDYPSLLALKELLLYYGINSAAIRKGIYNYSDFETPFVALIQHEHWANPEYVLIRDVVDDTIIYFDPIDHIEKSKKITIFEGLDKGIVLLLDSEHCKDEPGYLENKKTSDIKKLKLRFPYYVLFVFTLTSLIHQLFATNLNWLSLIFTITSCIGFGLCSLLILYEIDEHNPFLKEVCGGKTKKGNCGEILDSKGAKFLGISWVTWGGSFFATFYILQLIFSGQPENTIIWAMLCIIVSPFIIYSLYYQAIVARQWCVLCLGVQLIIFINAFFSLIYVLSMLPVLPNSWSSYTVPIFVGLLVLHSIGTVTMLLKKSKDSTGFEKRWRKLKYNPEIFKFLLQRNENIPFQVEGLGLVIGNPTAKREIVKVCNPYCGPCSKAHPELDSLIEKNSDVKLRIIFTASGETDDIKTAPVRLLLAIEEKYGTLLTRQALSDWYSLKEKDYNSFAERYIMNDNLGDQDEKIMAMRDWVDKMKIRATPTIFIDGYELPDGYRITELKNIL